MANIRDNRKAERERTQLFATGITVVHMDPIMPYFVGAFAVIFLIGIVLRRFRQPHVIAYLVAGTLLGPAGLGLIEDTVLIARLGEIGVVLLLFFAGMEMSLPTLIAGWRVPILGTVLQVAISVAAASGVCYWQGWPISRGVLLGFVISLSSTGVIMKLLRDRGATNEPMGRDVIGVLLVQDLAVIPMIITLGLLSGQVPESLTLFTQIGGGVLVIALLVFLGRRDSVRLPFGKWLRSDHELQVFSAFLLAFGLAFITGLAGLSTALGAFVAGIIVGAAHETEWVSEHLHPFHVLFLAFFFVSVGMLIDFRFLWQHIYVIVSLLVAALLINTVLMSTVFRILGLRWRNAVYGAATLAQIGEFSFVLAAIGQQNQLITELGYQITISVIALSLLVSPFWIQLNRRLWPPPTVD